MRIVYMGTPQFACPALEQLARDPAVEVALVVTQPDRAAGRGRKLQAPPVKELAVRLGLPVYQTGSLRTADLRQPIATLQPDLIVVAAFGLILGQYILELPPLGCINLHASLLPSYRGASPISAAILNGDATTGVTLMRMARGLDTGPTLASADIDIPVDATTESLTVYLAQIAGDLLHDCLSPLSTGTLTPVPQPEGGSLTRPLVKADGWVDWSQSAVEIERLVRAMWSWPRAWTTLPNGEPFQIHQASVLPSNTGNPANVSNSASGITVACGEGSLLIHRGQLPGGRPLEGVHLAAHPTLRAVTSFAGASAPVTPGPMITAVG